ncbi:BA75_01138T0 [Komagataella pastoris]|uniref:BA75_01138T0 n=1 Tax=Komagataella pastoris TaxID=4922 RepID=A0A1B2J5H6_PICPA|nr:BA75_01138T0 [Komagataella pastoris]
MSNGAELIVKTVSILEIGAVFGIDDFNTNPVLELFESTKINVIRFPNQKIASLASSIYGYIKSSPAILLLPGSSQFLDGLSGISNAQYQRWPLIVITISTDERNISHFSTSLVKFYQRCSVLDKVQKVLIQAFKCSINGRTGPTHIHFDSSVLTAPVEDSLKQLTKRNSYTKFSLLPESNRLDDIVFLLTKARNPLIVVGKNAASSSKAHIQLRSLVQNFHLPFITTAMARGTVPDFSQHSFTVIANESIENADFLILVGTSLKELSQNNFNTFNKNNKKVKVIQIDNVPEEIEDEFIPFLDTVYELALVGDLHDVLECLNERLQAIDYVARSPLTYLSKLRDQKIRIFTELEIAGSPESSVNMFYAFKSIRESFQEYQDDVYSVVEGFDLSNEFSSLLYPMFLPKQLIDVTSLPVPGNGLLYAMSLKAIERTWLSVFFFKEDAPLTFSVTDLITSISNDLPVICIIFNETKSVRYDLLCQSLNIDGFSATTTKDMDTSLKLGIQAYLKRKRSVVIDIQIESFPERALNVHLVPKM